MKVIKGNKEVIKPSTGILDGNGAPVKKSVAKDMEAIKKEREKRDKDNQKDFTKQLAEFKKENKYIKEYSDNLKSIKEGYVLVRLMVFKENAKTAMVSGILVPDPVSGEFKAKADIMDKTVTNYAKVILSGSDKYKSGEVVILPYDQIRGFYKNPEWEQYMMAISKSSSQPGTIQPIPPKDRREVIPAWETQMGHKRFPRPWLLKGDADDNMTFLISEHEIDGQ